MISKFGFGVMSFATIFYLMVGVLLLNSGYFDYIKYKGIALLFGVFLLDLITYLMLLNDNRFANTNNEVKKK